MEEFYLFRLITQLHRMHFNFESISVGTSKALIIYVIETCKILGTQDVIALS